MSQGVGNTTLAFTRAWHHVSARDRVLGKLAASIANVLVGKHKPRGVYDQSLDSGDYVVVTNARHVLVTGKKDQQMVYRHHTMYPGGLKEISYATMMQKKPDEIIRKAVSGMLPKNRLRDRRLERLKIFPDEEHPYEANIIKRYDLGDIFAAEGQPTASTRSKVSESGSTHTS
ncbi:50s ribosomal protein l13 [Ceraceosorus bombacis]|uniref:50s ribosomal protein l13 n=1 Tax=Ceraceosorus bombacis TaxID=401625 RepID=A0A0P1BDB9_9BASI|nr:50s ribosomal protein l13 [Ceraceosorus bombacis]